MSGTTSCLRLRLRLPLALLLALPALTPLSQAPAQSYRDMAKEAALKGENEKAVQNYELALNSAMKLFDENDIEIVIRRGELGEAYRAVGRWKEAIEQLDYAWRRARYDAETKKRWTGKEGELTLGFAEKLGRACQAAGRYEDAVLAFQTSLSDAERAGLPPGTLITPSGLLADTLLLLKREEEADKAVTQALEAARKAHADEPPALARDLATLAQVYQGQLRYAKALPLAQEALALAEKNFPQESRDLGLYQSRVGSLMVLAGDDEAAAKALLEKGRENLLKKQTRDAVELLLVELSLAKLASRQGEFDLCQKHSGEAWRICKMHYPAEHPETGRCYRQLADNFVAMEMSEDAAGLYAKALAIFEDSLGKDHPLSTETRMILVKSETQLLAEKEQAMKEKAMAVAEERARMVAEEKTKAEAAEKLRLEEEEKARIAAAEKAKMEEEKAQLAMKAKAEAEEKVRMAAAEKERLAEEKAQLAMKTKADAEEKIRLAAEAKVKKAEEKGRLLAEEKARMEAEKERLALAEKTRMEEAKAKKAAEEALLAEAKAKLAESRAAKAAAEKARLEEEKVKMAEKAKADAEEKAKLAAEEKLKADEAKAKLAAEKAEKAAMSEEDAKVAKMTATPASTSTPKTSKGSTASNTASAKKKPTVAATKSSTTTAAKPKPKTGTATAVAAAPRPRPAAPAREPEPEPEPEPVREKSTVGKITESVTGVTGAVTGAVSGAVGGTVKKLFNRKKDEPGPHKEDLKP